MPSRSRVGAIDHALVRLHEAISAPHRIPMVKIELSRIFPQIVNREHRAFLEDKLDEIERAHSSHEVLGQISDAIDDWNQREFPPERGFRR
jgi:hypothetical protein